MLRIRDGHEMPTLEDVRAHFRSVGVATQKWPEELHRVPAGEDFPRTASGKVQKYVIRQQDAESAQRVVAAQQK